jgi:hypothetical protein
MHHVVSTARWPALATLAALAMSGCFSSTADYREKAEEFIVENAGVADGLGVAVVSATCDEPVDQEVGTTFACTAVDENGDTWGFEVEIAESNRIELSVSERP